MLKKMIGAIKAGQAYLGWDDALYRQTLARLTGKTSTTRCNLDELRHHPGIHARNRDSRARHPPGKGRRPRVAMIAEKSVLSQIEALLADAGRSLGVCRRTGISHV